jgi:ybaK/ebsC protein
MAKKKVIKTNAIRIIEQQKISYVEHEYEWTDRHTHVSLEAKMEPPAKTFKTLVATGNKTGFLVAVIPSNRELDLKKLAKVSGNKKVEMLAVKDLEATTGYIRGGCSPVGMKKQFPTYFDQAGETMSTMTVSAGRRGLQIELNPQDLAKVARAEFVEIIEDEVE